MLSCRLNFNKLIGQGDCQERKERCELTDDRNNFLGMGDPGRYKAFVTKQNHPKQICRESETGRGWLELVPGATPAFLEPSQYTRPEDVCLHTGSRVGNPQQELGSKKSDVVYA